MSTLLSKNTISDKLWKMGGSLINAWQERWVIVSGTSLDYFENAKDNQSKGSVNLVGSKVRSYSTRERQFVFEVTNHILEGGKRREKKISFAVKDEESLKLWMSTIRKAGSADNSHTAISSPHSPNPLLGGGGGSSSTGGGEIQLGVIDSQRDTAVISSPSFSDGTTASLSLRDDRSTESPSSKSSYGGVQGKPAEKSGWLNKKSPNLLGLYQKRFFVLRNGEIVYYKSEEDYKNNMKPAGDISCRDIPMPKGLEIYQKEEVLLKAKGRIYQLRAASCYDAQSWVDAITEWCTYVRKEKL
jgi:hypothetical protein